MTESSADSSSVRFWLWLVAIAALGLAGRVGYIIAFSSRLNFGLDSVWYQLEGGALASDRYVLSAEGTAGVVLNDTLALELGYRWMNLSFHETTNEGDLTLTGPFLNVSVIF